MISFIFNKRFAENKAHKALNKRNKIFNNPEKNDDLLIGFKQIFNDFYAKDISKKVRAGVRQKQKNGMVVNLPMGYYKDKNTNEVLIDEIAADIVREIFQKYIDGYGLTTIARELNSQNIKSPEYFSHRKTGAQRTQMCQKFLWTQTTVKRLLQNEIYTGTLVNHKTVTSKIYKTRSFVPDNEQYRHENFLPSIIDMNVWDKAQILLEQRPKANVRATDGRKIHRYCGMIKCAECGAILIAKRRKYADGTEWVEYTCNSNHRYGKEYCTPHRIREEQLDEIVTGEVLRLKDKIMSESEKYDKIIKDWLKEKPKCEQRMFQYKDRISILKNQIENLIMERIGDRKHTEIYNGMIKKREDEIDCLEQKIADIQNYSEVSRKKKEQLKSTQQLLEEVLKEPTITDADLRLLIEKVLIHQNEDKSIDVRLEFNGDFGKK